MSDSGGAGCFDRIDAPVVLVLPFSFGARFALFTLHLYYMCRYLFQISIVVEVV